MNRSPISECPLDWSASIADYVASVSWAADGRLLLTSGSAGPLTLWTCNGAKVEGWLGHSGGTFNAVFSPTTNRIASTGQDGAARLWDPGNPNPVVSVEAGAEWVEQLAWAPDGSAFATGAGRQVAVWAPDGTLRWRFPALPSTATALAWRQDSAALAAASYSQVQRWNVVTGVPEEILPWKTSLISLAWSPDSRWIVAGTQEQTVQIWELPFRPGQELAMSGYSSKVRELAWHHNGRSLATGGGAEIMVWDCGGSGPAGTTPRVLEGHEQRVTSLAYQYVGHLLASGDEIGRVRLWNPRKQSTPLAGLELNSAITSLAWSRDDQSLALGTADGTVAVATICR
ncbi:MAG TPA: WD40 repeat domain-containing protein [Verrucomicrobiota bacterium]|nr:WD40 repeat domain-containing protein [Verrucomicrobiota bacterium]